MAQAAGARATSAAPPPRLLRLKRTALVIATALISINIWTGSPLLAVWAGSSLPSQ